MGRHGFELRIHCSKRWMDGLSISQEDSSSSQILLLWTLCLSPARKTFSVSALEHASKLKEALLCLDLQFHPSQLSNRPRTRWLHRFLELEHVWPGMYFNGFTVSFLKIDGHLGYKKLYWNLLPVCFQFFFNYLLIWKPLSPTYPWETKNGPIQYLLLGRVQPAVLCNINWASMSDSGSREQNFMKNALCQWQTSELTVNRIEMFYL